jgi:hypothetical protein
MQLLSQAANRTHCCDFKSLDGSHRDQVFYSVYPPLHVTKYWQINTKTDRKKNMQSTCRKQELCKPEWLGVHEVTAELF